MEGQTVIPCRINTVQETFSASLMNCAQYAYYVLSSSMHCGNLTRQLCAG